MLKKDKLNNKADEIWKSAIKLRGKFKAYESNNLVNTYYIHSFGETVLKKSQLLNKKVFIAIKNPSSIEKLVQAFIKNNPALCEKNVLIIDDEADAGSVGAKGKWPSN